MKYHPDVEAFSLQPIIMSVSGGLFCSLAAVTLSLRVYARVYLTTAFGKDDWLLLLAFAVYVANCGVFLKMAVIETTRGIVKPANTLGELTVAFFSLYIATQILLKLSLCAFFLHVIQERWQRLTILAAVASYTVYSLFLFFFGMFNCGPRTTTVCVGSQETMVRLNYTHAVLNAVMDWIFVLAPVLIVVRTSMPMRTKLSVCFIILLAAWGSVVSVIRIPFVAATDTAGPWYFAMEEPIAVLSIVESGLGIICLSAAALKPMAKAIARKMASVLSLSHGSEGSSRHGFANMGRAEDGAAGGQQMQQRPPRFNDARQTVRRSSLIVERIDQARRVDSAGKERLKEAQEKRTEVTHFAV